MPNGREGDHPVSDVLTWEKAPFSPEINNLIRRIASFTEDFGVYDPFAEVEDLIWAAAEDQSKERELRAALLRLHRRLRREWNRPLRR